MDLTAVITALLAFAGGGGTAWVLILRIKKAEAKKQELENESTAAKILRVEIVEPLREELKITRDENARLREDRNQQDERLIESIEQLEKAVREAKRCDFSDRCPVLHKLDKLSDSAITAKTQTILKEVHTDTILKIKADSSLIRALLSCDSAGNVYLKQLLDLKQGQHVKPPKAQVKDNILTVTCEVDSFDVYAKLKHRYKETSKTEVKITEVNRLTDWQSFQVWSGRIAWLLVVLLFTIKKLKK